MNKFTNDATVLVDCVDGSGEVVEEGGGDEEAGKDGGEETGADGQQEEFEAEVKEEIGIDEEVCGEGNMEVKEEIANEEDGNEEEGNGEEGNVEEGNGEEGNGEEGNGEEGNEEEGNEEEGNEGNEANTEKPTVGGKVRGKQLMCHCPGVQSDELLLAILK